jgi:hypothetical protein
MAFFYPPPPPFAQGSASYAPPIPHEPPPSAGSEPPRRQVQAALMMVAVLASWPADQEPRLHTRNANTVKIAPLTLPTGQQPPPRQTYRLPTVGWDPPTWPAQKAPISGQLILPPIISPPPPYVRQSLVGSWPTGWAQPQALIQLKQPLTGDQPPINAPLSATELAITRSWPTDWPAQKPPINAAIIPPPSGAQSFLPGPREQNSILSAWYDATVIEVVTTWTIAPDNPDQPPITGPSSPTEIAIQRSWAIDWPSQRAPLLVQPSSGDQPVRQSPLLASQLAQIRLAWEITWSSQSKAVAATQPTTPTINVGPLPTADVAIVGAWPRGWDQPQRLPTLKQPSTGDQPSPQGPLTQTELLIQRLWPTEWPAQTGPKVAAWFVPPVVNQPTPEGPISPTNLALIVASWPTAWAAQSRPIVVVQPSPGAQPIPQGPLSPSEISESVGAWPTTWPAQARPLAVVQGTPAPPSNPPLTATELVILQAWPRGWDQPQRLVTAIQPGSSQPVPSGPLTATEIIIAVSQWAQTWPAQSAPTMIASLPPPGSQPPPIYALSVANLGTVVAQWQPNWPAQSVKPRRNDSAIVHFKPEWAANSNQLLGPSKSQPETH